MILLIGIVLKNAIMVVNFAIQRENEGATAAEGGLSGSPNTVQADYDDYPSQASLGALPIALGLGAGSQARQPLGLIIVGGLILSPICNVVSDSGSIYLSR